MGRGLFFRRDINLFSNAGKNYKSDFKSEWQWLRKINNATISYFSCNKLFKWKGKICYSTNSFSVNNCITSRTTLSECRKSWILRFMFFRHGLVTCKLCPFVTFVKHCQFESTLLRFMLMQTRMFKLVSAPVYPAKVLK